jgi:protein phosphatase 2C family protein 2/3
MTRISPQVFSLDTSYSSHSLSNFIFLWFIQLESISEDKAVVDRKQNALNFVPSLRSGEWSDIGCRPSMEDTHICIGDLAKKFGYNLHSGNDKGF